MPAGEIERAASAIEQATSGQHLLLLLDFDGTLADLNPDPQAVFLPEERRRLLLTIHDHHHATVAIVSGRRLSDVRQRAKLPPDNYHAGLHGLEIEGHGERFEHPQAATAMGIMRELVQALAKDLNGIPGVSVEDKTLSLVLHFRAAAPDDAARLPGLLARHAQRYLDAGELRIMHGNCMIELLPNIDWTKGNAVAWIRERVAAASERPVVCVYIGDDVTDQDAFAALGDNGIAVAASNRASGAHFYVQGPPEVEALLRQLALR